MIQSFFSCCCPAKKPLDDTPQLDYLPANPTCIPNHSPQPSKKPLDDIPQLDSFSIQSTYITNTSFQDFSLRVKMAEDIKTKDPNYGKEPLSAMDLQTLNKIHSSLPPSPPPTLLSLLERRNYF